MALGSTNASFFWLPFLKETDQELHLRAGGSVRWRKKKKRACNAQAAASRHHHPHFVGLWEGEHNPATKPIKPFPSFNYFTTFTHFCHTYLAGLRPLSFKLPLYPPHDRPNTKLRVMFQVPTMSRVKTSTLK